MRLNELTATELVQAIAAGKTNCESVTRACLERIAEREPQVTAQRRAGQDEVERFFADAQPFPNPQ